MEQENKNKWKGNLVYGILIAVFCATIGVSVSAVMFLILKYWAVIYQL